MVIPSPRRTWFSARRAVAGLLLVATMAPRTDAAAAGPFTDFDWTEHVTTSRDGYAMWARLPSGRYSATLPPHEEPVGPPGARPAVLQVHCRAPGAAGERAIEPTPTHALLYVDDHPLQPDAYTVFHPMYWIRGLTGQSLERWRATAQFGNGAQVNTELVRRLTDYSAPRPGLDLALSADAVLAVFEAGLPVNLEVQGEEWSIAARFTPVAELAKAARAMRRECGAAPVGAMAPR